jgi:predicted dehydrogenase
MNDGTECENRDMTSNLSNRLRIGTLGAARITPMALVRPARQLDSVEIVAVAARDPAKAAKFAGRHGIARVHASYAALLADPDIDAIYNPLPNGLHCEWTIRALEAGKHVLCEKPLASNADEARQMADAAARTGRVLVEAFHYRYHPLMGRVREILDAGDIGEIRHVEAVMAIPVPVPGDIRYRFDLAGGATMDMGSYTVNLVRFLGGGDPEVVSARARLSSPGVDRRMAAQFRLPGGATGEMLCSLFSATLPSVRARVLGSQGELRVTNPIAPHLFHRLTLRRGTTSTRERVRGDATYTHQLRAFAAHVRGGPAMATDAEDGVANMRVIDAIYAAAGLPRRGDGPA